ncbi:fasciclin-1 [Diaphorina citri]|uniref:Fasciclin-1 n=1 Tax=Diaphorina citri TaxID=121845 RepID=A0A3Q0IX09_DIACI|nr:fasciclin-1 [Diaphorina citri]
MVMGPNWRSSGDALFQFYSYFEANPEANFSLLYRQLTLFAPTNAAFQNYKNVNKSDTSSISELINYHLSNQAYTLAQLGSKVSTELTANPPLWVTRRPSPNGQGEDIYVNNAKVNIQKSNFQYTNPNKKKQVLHIIEDVLEPLKSKGDLYNPDAYELLTNYNAFDIHNHTLSSSFITDRALFYQNRGLLSSFYERILDLAPEFLSQIADSETITLFAPNNAAMQSPSLAALFTNKTAFRQVLDLHLIKGKKITSEEVLNKGLTEIPSQLPRKNLYLNVVQREDNTTFSLGSKVSTELTANPPLWVTRRPSPNGQGEDIYVNNAKVNIQKSNFQYTNPNKKKQVTNQAYTLAQLGSKVSTELTANPPLWVTRRPSPNGQGEDIYVNNAKDPINRAGAIDTKIIDGHIIPNHVLFTRPTPFDVKYETLAFGDNVKVFIEFKKESQDKDSRSKSAHKLGEMLHFNDQLDNSRYRYTYFVPRDSAWKKIEIQSPSVYKKVFMQEFAPNVKQILERHLVISDKAYTMADLKQLANVSFTLPSVRDKLEIKVTESEADKTFEKYELPEETHWYDLGGYFRKRTEIKPGTGEDFSHPFPLPVP